MNTILWIFLAAAGVPDVTAGPDLAEAAVLVEAPISEVTVFSDRARVLRSVRHKLNAGNQTLRLPDLPGSVRMDTVRVGCEGGRVLRVEAVPIERERWTIEQVEGLIDQLETLTDQLSGLDSKRSVYQIELNLLAGIAPRGPVPEQERVGKGFPAIEPGMWKRVLDFLQQRREKLRATLRDMDEQRRKLVEALQKVQREVGRHNLGAFTDRKIQVLAIVNAKSAGMVTLSLEYFVPGASWRPTYDLTYLSSKAQVNLRTAGLVQQASGEDWSDVSLHLSTAIPGQGIKLPEMLTWALGEKKEFIPQARAARMPAQAPRFPAPIASKTPYEAKREARMQVLRQRIAHTQRLLSLDGRATAALAELSKSQVLSGGLDQAVGIGSVGYGRGGGGSGRVAYKSKSVYEFADDSISGELARPSGASMHRPRPQARPRRAPPPPPSPSMAPREESARADSSRIQLSGKRSTGRVATTSLQLFSGDYWVPPRFSDPNLPAVVAGGLDYIYSCPTRMSIPSTGEKIAVPLSMDSYPAVVFYEATPSLKETAYLKAEVENRGKQPILGGAVNIFMGPDFSGQGRLATTGPGGKLPLPLGADEDIRLKRTVVPKTVTEGVFSKDEVTDYQVTIEVGNYKRRRVRIAIIDQIPKSGLEDIEIEKGSLKPKPVKGPDVDGIIRWELDIPAGKTSKIEFSYKIERPENWQLHQ